MILRSLQQVLLLLLLIAVDVSFGASWQRSRSFGGPGGEEFSDEEHIVAGQTVNAISIRTGKWVGGITLEISAPEAMNFTHGIRDGGTRGYEARLELGANEYLTSMETYWAKRGGRVRVVYVNIGTSDGNSISGGMVTPKAKKKTLRARDGYQIGGFCGTSSSGIDSLGVIWTTIVSKNKTINPAYDEDIELSQAYGGSRGIAFSDITNVILGQTMSSVTINGARRIDQVTLRTVKPVEATWTHGGSGGADHNLTLGSGEYITTMELHWDKKLLHDRIFYLKFTTSKGNSISAGTKTRKSVVLTAPDGFELGGLFGRAADQVDQLGAIWTRRDATQAQLTDKMGSDWYGVQIRNWVGPTIGYAADSACYRKKLPSNRNGVCPLGYSRDTDNCITQCPISYPVECLAECIPKNDDCLIEIAQKIASVAAVAFNTVTGGIFKAVWSTYKTVKRSYMCAATIFSVIKSLVFYIRFQQTTAPQGAVEELLAVAYQTDVVLIDLPVAVCTCLGLPVPKNAVYASIVTMIVENIVKQAIINGDAIVSSAKNVMDLLKNTSLVNASDTSVTELQSFINANTSCGYELKRLTDRVIFSVEEIRNKTPDASVDDIRVTVSKSPLVLRDVPAVTNNCMKEMLAIKTKTAAFQTRDLLRKTVGVIIEQLITTSTTDMGANVAKDDSAMNSANWGLVVLGSMDPTGIIWVVSQFVQPTCGPTAFIGEIDDGTLHNALGLSTVDEAFEGSYGFWTKKGDGAVLLSFESSDTKDVNVVIHSGGDTFAKVKVPAGKTVTWNSTITELQDKTLYLDRWRPNFIGLPGAAGGSLLLWVPRSSEGGHITLHVRVNRS